MLCGGLLLGSNVSNSNNSNNSNNSRDVRLGVVRTVVVVVIVVSVLVVTVLVLVVAVLVVAVPTLAKPLLSLLLHAKVSRDSISLYQKCHHPFFLAINHPRLAASGVNTGQQQLFVLH